jgi:hypothetical protein
MKYEITQTITQTITKVVDVADREEALALIEDEKFREELEVQRMDEWETDEDWEVKAVLSKEPIYHARRCDVTGEGMDSGWVCGDDYYIKYQRDLIEHLIDVYNQENATLNAYETDKASGLIDEDKLREMYYEDGYFYLVDWKQEEDIMYVEVDGKVRLMKADDYKIRELNKGGYKLLFKHSP